MLLHDPAAVAGAALAGAALAAVTVSHLQFGLF